MSRCEDTIYTKRAGKYVPIAPHSFEGFPSDGIWMVKFQNGYERSASCVARLDDLPTPYPFYNMMLSREEIATCLVEIFDGQPISLQQAADRIIKFLAELNKPEKLKIKFPTKPIIPLKVPDKNTPK